MRTAIALVLIVFSGCLTRGNGEPGTRAYEVAPFHEIVVSGVFQVDASVGPVAKVELKGDANLLDKVVIDATGGDLRAEIDGSILPDLPLKLIVVSPTLDAIDVSGATRANVTGITGERFEVEASGASKVTLAGEVKQLDIDVSGASLADATALVATTVEIDASGASNVSTTANESLTVDASGASEVTWSGTATKLNIDTSGASSVTQR
jgi:hypothetical protein